MPRRREFRRLRTSSQSSVEIQVTKEEAIITTTTSSTPTQITTQNSQRLVQPKQDFLRLLHDADAFGTSCRKEFTLKDLGNFLYEYIKKRELWDPNQPEVIHCEKDPLGRVFGVKTFTRQEAASLLLKNTFPVNFRKRRYPENERVSEGNTGIRKEITAIEQISSTSSPGGNSSPTLKRSYTPPQSSIVDNPSSSQLVDGINIVFGRKSPSFGHGNERKSPIDPQWNEDRSPSSGNDGPRAAKRARQTSLSIVYDGNSRESTCPLFFQVELPGSDSEDEVYSVQSKVTDVIQSSADDTDWSDDEHISTQERLSIEIGSIHSTDPPFEEEYDVVSDSGSSIDDAQYEETYFSHEEFILVCRDSDKEFWADSESSDNDSDTSSDLDIIAVEKWTCRNCENRNTPVRSRCDKCYEIRPDWIVERRRYPYRGRFRRLQRQSQSVPNSPRPTSSSEIGSYSDHELIAPSPGRTFSVKSLFELAQFACNKRKIVPGYGSMKNTTESAEQKGNGAMYEKVENAVLVISNQLLRSDSESGSTDILNSSDEAEMSSKLRSFEDANAAKAKFCDSGIGESFYSSQGSIMEGFMSGKPLPAHMDWTPLSQHEASDSGLDSSCGLTKSSIATTTIPSAISSEGGIWRPTVSVEGVQLHTSQSFSNVAADIRTESTTMMIRSQSLDPKVQQKKRLKQTSHITTPVKGGSTGSDGTCMICCVKPKDASLVHGKSGHQVCCYPCGQKLKRNAKPCPVCRRQIEKVIVNYQA